VRTAVLSSRCVGTRCGLRRWPVSIIRVGGATHSDLQKWRDRLDKLGEPHGGTGVGHVGLGDRRVA
jgi:hypothetical protein